MRLFPHKNSEIPSYSKPSTIKYRIANLPFFEPTPKVLTPKKDYKMDRDKVLGTDLRFLEKSRKMVQKDEKAGKNHEIYS